MCSYWSLYKCLLLAEDLFISVDANPYNKPCLYYVMFTPVFLENETLFTQLLVTKEFVYIVYLQELSFPLQGEFVIEVLFI